jgi:hypothetical protein
VNIIPNQTFLDGRNRYEEGKVYDVADGLAVYFSRMGWASAPDLDGVEPDDQPLEVTLDIASASHGHKAQNAGGSNG